MPHCGTTHEYLSFNNGQKKSQIKCKVCEKPFLLKKVFDLTKDNQVSKQHRPTKQLIKHLNRIFQCLYTVKNAFNTLKVPSTSCVFSQYTLTF